MALDAFASISKSFTFFSSVYEASFAKPAEEFNNTSKFPYDFLFSSSAIFFSYSSGVRREQHLRFVHSPPAVRKFFCRPEKIPNQIYSRL
jgi:hypothetical protein